MKKIIVVSDNHGDDEILDIIKNNENDADCYIHLGDSETNNIHLLDDFIAVSGNNDWMIDLPNAIILEIENLRFLLTHGQRFGYFDKEERMYHVLEENDCDVLLSGHTHIPNYTEYKDKIMINPGSTSWPRGGSNASYAVLFINNNKIECKFINI